MRKKLKNIGRLPDEVLFSYFRQIVDAGIAMYEEGVVHRDLKPENILLQTSVDEEQIKIADFGEGRLYPLL